jgi:hypothetical protein
MLAVAWSCLFGVGYYWWRCIFAAELGFPQTLSGAAPNDISMINTGYPSLSNSLACVAAAAVS